ncbi:protein NO VEIN domain-containing protein [Mycobacteroides abscessus]|uniref:protein NO VEIN domain-containing protein n=1 Tax=Mycobacteroides abscessus TaxID=36809 RepID=UPI001878C571|nr:hypothetical protein [Mycobacteroides abscessus]
MTDTHRDEILDLLRKADCHYGNTIRDEDDELTPAEAAAKRDVKPGRIVELRRAVHQVADGEHSRVAKWAAHEDAVLRALLNREAEMTPELHQYVLTRLEEVQSDPRWGLKVTTEPLACNTRGAQARRTRTAATPHLEPTPVSDYDELPEPETDTAPEATAAVDDAEADWPAYASAEEIREVHDLAMRLAMEEAARRWPDATVQRMPHNNPGYDIEVRHTSAGTRYIEVKGTRSPDPCFFITSGEVAHSERHPDRYSIWIFAAMDLAAGAATLHEHDGPVTEVHFELRPVQYRGRLTGPS